MKALSVFLKVLSTLVVCVWGVFFGLLFPIGILIGGEETYAIASQTGLVILWLVTSAAGYIVPAALLWGNHHRLAAALSTAGLVGVLVMKGIFVHLYENISGSDGPDNIYLPLIFSSIINIFILVIEERANIKKLLERNRPDEDAPAPSILGDGRTAEQRALDEVSERLGITKTGDELICPMENAYSFVDEMDRLGFRITASDWWCHVTKRHEPCGLGGPKCAYDDTHYSELPTAELYMEFSENSQVKHYLKQFTASPLYRECYTPCFFVNTQKKGK